MLSTEFRWLFRCTLVLLLCSAGVAAAAAFVLVDIERKQAISNSAFAEWVYSLMKFNQVSAHL